MRTVTGRVGLMRKKAFKFSMKLVSLTAEDGCLHFLIFPILTTSLTCLTCLAFFCLFLLIMESLLGKCYTSSFVPHILHFPFLTPPPPQFLKISLLFSLRHFYWHIFMLTDSFLAEVSLLMSRSKTLISVAVFFILSISF